MCFPKRLPFNRCRNMSGVKISGTFSRKYPEPALPFTRTPSPRSCRTHCQTIERDTPISRAIRAPLITIVAFSASSVSNAASRLSVVPGRVSWAIEVLLCISTSPKLTYPRLSGQAKRSFPLKLSQSLHNLLQLDPLLRESRFQPTNNLLRRSATKSLVPKLALFRRYSLPQPCHFFLEAYF